MHGLRSLLRGSAMKKSYEELAVNNALKAIELIKVAWLANSKNGLDEAKLLLGAARNDINQAMRAPRNTRRYWSGS